MYTEAINHDPAITFFQTGSQIAGRPSVRIWLSYGLGSMNDNLPAFVAMVSTGTGRLGVSRFTIDSGGAVSCPRPIGGFDFVALRSGFVFE